MKCVEPHLTFSIHNLCSQELSPVAVCFRVTEGNFGPIVHESPSSCPRVALVPVTFSKGRVQHRCHQQSDYQAGSPPEKKGRIETLAGITMGN